ncbi:restriction endonuclease subunit S [Paenibacillus sp. 2KB_22]|uniref:restriction endonuclease subunit S n=1 Tax=Paenibacillus sp. 2KB_22 TaxID=3232978 RepID=UPI003F9B10BC
MSKKLKSQEELLKEALVPEKEQPYEVPDNWIWVKSEAVATWGSGGTPSRKKTEYYKGNIPWIKTGELRNKIITEAEEYITEEAVRNSSAKLFPKGSVAIAMYGATIGKVGILGIDATTNQACAVGIPNERTTTMFMFHFFRAQKEKFINLGKGGAQPNISQAIIKNYPFPLPPLNEQIRIADKVERLLGKINQAKQLIEEAKATFELRRAAILDKAFRGGLTKKWREETLPTETAINWLVENGVEINNKKVLEGPFKLPDSWTWVGFSDVSSVVSNLVNPLSYGNLPHIAPDNIEKYTGVLLDYVTIKEAGVKSPKHLFEKGQIIYSKIRPNLSKLMIADFNGLCSADMYPISSHLNINYLYWFMLSAYFVEKASTAGSRSVLPKINQKELGQIMVPVCGFDEQTEIAKLIECFMNKNNEALKKLNEILEIIIDLEKSILSKAFTGQLGTNKPKDEFAIEVLDKI